MPKEYTLSFKREAIHRYEQGTNLNALSQELHIALSTLYHWRKEYGSIQTANHTYTPKEFDALVKKAWFFKTFRNEELHFSTKLFEKRSLCITSGSRTVSRNGDCSVFCNNCWHGWVRLV